MQKQSDIDVGFGRSVRRRRVTIVFAALAVLLVVLATLNLCIGSLNVPLEERQEGGIGIMLARKFAQSVDYRRTDGKSIITVVI